MTSETQDREAQEDREARRPPWVNTIRIISINGLIFLVLFGVLEIGFRLAYPEFRGHIFSDSVSLGKRVYHKPFLSTSIRVPCADCEPTVDKDKPILFVFGDSISYGYGLSWEDVYWAQLKRKFDLYLERPPQIVTMYSYGNDLACEVGRIEQLLDELESNGYETKYFLYQFNYNDITRFCRADLKSLPDAGIAGTGWFRSLARLRYEYLNHSVFLRVLQHWASPLLHRTSGTCEERGFDALGSLTWTYGSRTYRDEANQLWTNFDEALGRIAKRLEQLGASFIIYVSPIVWHIDPDGVHPPLPGNQDFSCATIDPLARLKQYATRHGITLIDPTPHLRSSFQRRLSAQEFVPYFHTADGNHLNEVGSLYIAEVLLGHFLKHEQIRGRAVTEPCGD